jgi:hypothetical protein
MKVRFGNYIGPRSKKERVVKVQIDPWDTWNMDHTLAMIIEPMLIQLKETQHGFPGEMYVLTGMKPEDSWQATEEQTAAAVAKWYEILDAMIWSFHEVNKAGVGTEHDHLIAEYGRDWTKHVLEYDDKVQVGLDYFGKYFRSLWD